MTLGKTPFEAGQHWHCPMARVMKKPGGGSEDGMCRGPNCAAWRWIPLSARSPAFQAAIKMRMSDAGEGHQKAVAYVMANREEFNLPTSPEYGRCGLAGEIVA